MKGKSWLAVLQLRQKFQNSNPLAPIHTSVGHNVHHA